MSPNPEARYNLTELADLAGVTPRTVRYYLSQGLLQAVGTAGPGAKYDDGHLARLRVIRRLQREHQPLAEIRRRLESLDDVQVRALAEPPAPEPGDSALDYIRRVLSPRATAESPAAYAPAAPATDVSTEPRVERSQWERIVVAPDVEIHIRRPLPRSTAKRVDRLVSIARDLLEEDPS
jgi:DNA-binding transcriptional MerR regulator